jgi:hypothetical protein
MTTTSIMEQHLQQLPFQFQHHPFQFPQLPHQFPPPIPPIPPIRPQQQQQQHQPPLPQQPPQPPQNRYRGVTFDRPKAQWRARLYCRGTHVTLGRFATEILAARAHDRAAYHVHGARAATNFGVESAREDLESLLLSEPHTVYCTWYRRLTELRGELAGGAGGRGQREEEEEQAEERWAGPLAGGGGGGGGLPRGPAEVAALRGQAAALAFGPPGQLSASSPGGLPLPLYRAGAASPGAAGKGAGGPQQQQQQPPQPQPRAPPSVVAALLLAAARTPSSS